MRSTLLAVGLFVLFWGVLFLLTQRMEIQLHRNLPVALGWWTGWGDNRAVFHPPEWVGFSLGSIGLVTVIFAVGLPRRKLQRFSFNLPVNWSSESRDRAKRVAVRST